MQRVHIAIIKDNNTAPTVLTIPDNPTNGDICRAIFDTMTCNYILSTMGINWWNSKYKRIVGND